MKIVRLCAVFLLIAMAACTKSKTDYEAEIATVVPEHYTYEEAAALKAGNYSISIEALNGTFYKGYNKLHLKVTNTQTKEVVQPSSVTFLPIISQSNAADSSCPHKYNLKYDAPNSYFSGYCVFSEESSQGRTWKLYIGLAIEGRRYAINKEISVSGQSNKNLNMVAFKGSDGQDYVISLVGPQKPKVGENALVAGIYKYDKPMQLAGSNIDPAQFSYSIVNGFTLQIDPRMPEPSMGNHSSPNNQNLVQQSDSLYHGVVNYTMTGNWTLNFIMQDENGRVIKGTVVPTTFTPGVEGVKSELHINTLF